MTPLAATIPCDLAVFPDLLCRGTTALYPNGQRVTVLYAGEPVSVYNGASDRREEPPRSALSLDLSEPLGRARLAHVLHVGRKCPACDGTGDHPLRDAKGQTCDRCSGTGYLRKPAPAAHLLPVSELGTLPDGFARHSPRLLQAHAESVAGGGPGVVGVLGEWEWTALDYGAWARQVLSEAGREARGVRGCVYRAGRPDSFGESAGDRAIVDERHLAAGWATIDPGPTLRLPTWGKA